MNSLKHPAPSHFEISDEEIQHAAYLLWQAEGRPAGRDLDLWLRAKEQLRHRENPPVPVATLPSDDEPSFREEPADVDPL